MKCPICNDVRMREVEKEGIMIDVCPECKGVWLDRGELEKLMSDVREMRPAFNSWYDEQYERRDDSYERREPYRDHDKRYDSHQGYSKHGYKKKKKSVLDVFGDLFD